MQSYFKKCGCKAVVFDMDGVLIDSEPLHLEILNLTCKPLGFEISKERFETFIGTDEVTFWSWAMKTYALALPMEDYIRTQIQVMSDFFASAKQLPAVAGIPALLSQLQSEGIRIGLASSSNSRVIADTLRALGLRDWFAVISAADVVGRGKPHPDVYLDAMRRLGVSPDECGAIEDTDIGLSAAQSAGIGCIVGYRNPSSGKQALTKAQTVIDAIDKLLL